LSKLFFILTICAALSTGCPPAEPPYIEISHTQISAEYAYAMINKLDDFVLLDVRTYDEFRARRIDGSILIPYSELASRASAELSEKNAVILVYCQSGRRSAIAARTLAELGYTNVYDFGGIADWAFGVVSAYD